MPFAGDPGSGPVSIGGRVYDHTIAVGVCTIYGTEPTYTWSLGGGYTRLSGVLGQDDGSESHDALTRVTVRGDGAVLASSTLGYGSAAPLSVDVTRVRRLQVSITEVHCGPGGAAVALGSLRVR